MNEGAKKPVLGIAGGMGPYATALFYKRLTELTNAQTDSGHIECIIYSAPQIPDRIAYLTGASPVSPLGAIIDICRMLEEKADIIAIPCMTAHHFYDEIAAGVSVPVLDMQRICARYAEKAGITAPGIMATGGTLASGRLQRILREHKAEPVLPSDQDAITELITDVKAGRPLKPELFHAAASDLTGQGAQIVMLACTELQCYAGLPGMPPVLDTAQLLALECIEACGCLCNETGTIVT